MPENSVSDQEVDKEFYDAYRTRDGKLDPRLEDPNTKQPRPLTSSPADAQFRAEWVKIKNYLQQQRSCAPRSGGDTVGAVGDCPYNTLNPNAPKYEPELWNDGGNVQNSTNCYAYAMNSRLGHPRGGKPQPGYKSLSQSPSSESGGIYCQDVAQLSLADGKPDCILHAEQCRYQKRHKLPPPEKSGYYLVALYATGRDWLDRENSVHYASDYHWVRQDSDGGWSHKPGHLPATRFDSANAVITNPQTANMQTFAGYESIWDWSQLKLVKYRIIYDYRFCGYFYVKASGCEVKP